MYPSGHLSQKSNILTVSSELSNSSLLKFLSSSGINFARNVTHETNVIDKKLRALGNTCNIAIDTRE
jgi:hypothetical protein